MNRPADDHHLMARYRRKVEQAKTITDATLETGQHVSKARKTKATPGGDPMQMRLIPVMGAGILGGVIPGTAPHTLPFLTPSERAA